MTAGDHRAAALEFLRAHGADTTHHLFGDLLDRLVGKDFWMGARLLDGLGVVRPSRRGS